MQKSRNSEIFDRYGAGTMSYSGRIATVSLVFSVVLHASLFYFLIADEPKTLPEVEKPKAIEFVTILEAEKPQPQKVEQPKKETKKVSVKKIRPEQHKNEEPLKPSNDGLLAAKTDEPKPQQKEPTLEKAEPKERTEPQKQTMTQDKLALYLSYVRKNLESNLVYPAFAKKIGLQGSVVVCFCIKPDGSVPARSIRVQKSSGFALLDKHAIETVITSTPFDKAPPNEIEVSVPVTFNLKT